MEEKLNLVLRRSIPSEMISMLGMSSDSGMLMTLLVVESASLFPLNVVLSFTLSFSLSRSLFLSLSLSLPFSFSLSLSLSSETMKGSFCLLVCWGGGEDG